jgi:type I restriction modification DNA specificity domain protein
MKSVNQYVMKDSGVQWIGAVPEHWEVCKVKNKYSFSTGFTPPKNNEEYYDYSNEGYTWICISDMKAKEIECSANSISRYYVDTFKPAIVKKGSLLYSFKLSVGQVSFAKKDLFTNEAIVSFHDLDSVCLPYLYYSSQICIIQNAETNIYGAKLLNQERIKEATILFPPLSEQRAIADWLDAKCADIDAAIELQQRMIDKLKAYKTAVIHQAVTKGLDKNANLKDSGVQWIGEVPQHWEVCKIKNICTSVNRGCTPNYVENGTYYAMNQATFSKGFLDYSSLKFTTENRKSAQVLKQDILLASTGGGVLGKVWYYNDDVDLFYAVADVIILRVDPKENDARYLYYDLSIKYQLMNALFVNGSTNQIHLQRDLLKNHYIQCPPLAEQRAIADWLDAKCADIDATIALKEQKQEKLKAYKKTIIFEYVTGKKQVANINK